FQVPNCLICGELTRIAHLGIDVCRACAVFYRRAKRGNNFVCRKSSSQCLPGTGLNCKRCRFDNLLQLLARSKAQTEDAAIDIRPQESTAVVPNCKAIEKSDKPLLERLKTHYK
ncbi:hypothetical protein PFISCL1PPCAC_13135, partial [Pristionchus fissidentatus]